MLVLGRMSSCSKVCGSKQAQAATEGGYQRYGVRSYLHQFYEDCTTSIWEYEDDFQIQRSPNRWSSVFWKSSCVAAAASSAYWRKLRFQIDLISSQRYNEGDVGQNNSSFWLIAPGGRTSGIQFLLHVQSSFPAAGTGFPPVLPIVKRVIRCHSTKTATAAAFQVGLISGTVFVVLGLAVLAVGFLVPPKIEAFGEANFVVVDTHAIQFNGALDMCKLAGAVLFCIGGTSMAGCLLMSVFAKSYSKEEKFLQQKFKERIADLKVHPQPITRAPGPGETKIPVTLSRVQNVQPVSAT
ncbi:hypothetical protein CB1_000595066 [Camelus ferus]|nr:hypothetical protein CB1_000595066 [Camelus ferus]